MISALVAAGALSGGALGFVLRGRRYLEQPSSPLSWWFVAAAAAASAAAMGALAWRVVDPVLLAAGCLFVAGGVVAVWTDLDAHLLLDVLTLPLAGTILVLLTGAAVSTGEWGRWWLAVGAAVVVSVVLLLWAIFGSLGFGDVKLGLAVGLVLGYAGGWAMTIRGVLFSLLLAAVFAVVLLMAGRSRKSHLPLGPALVLGVFACLVV